MKQLNNETISNLKTEVFGETKNSRTTEILENLRIKYLGRKGKINLLLSKIPKLPPKERSRVGERLNKLKKEVERLLKEQEEKLGNWEIGKLKGEWIDVTTPGVKPPIGHLHLITQAIREISAIFEKIGFIRVSYPEIEYDRYGFEGLNMPKNHPARDEWETFFVDLPAHPKLGEVFLTPHTSSGQLREMERLKKPPIRMINIAKCFRRQSDISHNPMFHQFETLMIAKDLGIPDLKGLIEYFVQEFFGPERKIRLRPFHFQFTEPSFEIDISCHLCKMTGCRFCKSGWVEIAGAGMVHPQVLKNGGIDPKKYSGYASGWGVERTFMMREGIRIEDIRMLYSNDLRFLAQF